MRVCACACVRYVYMYVYMQYTHIWEAAPGLRICHWPLALDFAVCINMLLPSAMVNVLCAIDALAADLNANMTLMSASPGPPP